MPNDMTPAEEMMHDIRTLSPEERRAQLDQYRRRAGELTLEEAQRAWRMMVEVRADAIAANRYAKQDAKNKARAVAAPLPDLAAF